MAKYLALDYGQVRTGVAVSDAGGRMAFPRCTLIKRTRDQFFADLFHVLKQEAPDSIVIGLPLGLDGEDTETTRQVRNFTNSLLRRTPLPVYWMSETLSSCQAEQDLREAGYSARASRPVLDQQAAVCILQSFLDQPEVQRKVVTRKGSTQEPSHA